MTTSKYKKLCVKDFSGEISKQEKQRLNVWLEKSPQNQSLYEELNTVWQKTNPPTLPQRLDHEVEWKRLQNRIENIQSVQSKKKKSVWNSKKQKGLTVPGILRPVSLGLAIVIIVIAGLLITKIKYLKPPMESVITQNQEKIELLLADGTQVRLNSQSKLVYQKEFSDSTRWVYLEGEAFFDVVSNGKPFIVYTDQAKTTVLGTCFNVRARYHETRVIVKEGRVRVDRLHDIPHALSKEIGKEKQDPPSHIDLTQKIDEEESSILLTPNQMGEISNSRIPIKKQNVNAEHLLGWLEGKLVFDQTPLSEIIDELERQFGITIHLTHPELGTKTMTAFYEDESIEEILYSISLALGVQCSVENKNQFTMN